MAAFAPVTFLLALGLLIWTLHKQNSRLIFMNLMSMILSGNLIFMFLETSHDTTSPSLGTLSVTQVNLYHHNVNNDMLEAVIDLNADVVSVQELNSRWIKKLSHSLQKTYRHHVVEQHDSCCYGIGIFSKHQILGSHMVKVEGVPILFARVDFDNEPLTIVSMHTLPPVFPNQTLERNRQLHLVAQLISEIDGPVILLGDLNVVTWDTEFTKFLETAGLTNSIVGYVPTYPMDFGIPLIQIDHIAHSKELNSINSAAFIIPGSDHKGLTAEFQLKTLD